MSNYLGWTDQQWSTACWWYVEKFGAAPAINPDKPRAHLGVVRAAWQQYRGIVQP